jgi:hypothetical protein
MAQGDDIVPLVGARKRDRLAEALGALRVSLSKSDLDAIEAIVPAGAAAGDRYNAYLMGDWIANSVLHKPIGVGASAPIPQLLESGIMTQQQIPARPEVWPW